MRERERKKYASDFVWAFSTYAKFPHSLEEKDKGEKVEPVTAPSPGHVIFLNALEDYGVNFINVFTT